MSSSQSAVDSMSKTPALPPYTIDSWLLTSPPDKKAIRRQLKDCTVSSLTKSCVDLQLKTFYDQKNSQQTRTTPSLSSLSAGSILDALNSSGNPTRDATTIIVNLNFTTLKQLLNDPRLSYQIFRVLHALLHLRTNEDWQGLVDIDEIVLRGERYVRSRGAANEDGQYLVRLEELPHLTYQSQVDHQQNSAQTTVLSFIRQDIRKGGLEVLDHVRNESQIVIINATDQSFNLTFKRITLGILDGLDWSNVFMAGGMALTTLMHTEPSGDDDLDVIEPDIDLYIYGLGPEDANAKVHQIYDTWRRNLPADSQGCLVVKNAKTINFLANYPIRRIQIVLKLLASPTDILLNFDLDACAIGFDGTQVLMLPRFVRALETGYSVFTMDLVWGHHLGDRRATQDSRVFKYAYRGFGLRFLPSLAKSLEDDLKMRMAPNETATALADTTQDTDDSYHKPRNRCPDSPEPGLKTLKRIAYLARDYVHRFVFGTTALAISPERFLKSLNPQYVIDEDAESEWQYRFERAQEDQARYRTLNKLRRANNEPCKGPCLKLAALDGDRLHHSLPNGRRGLGDFEIFMRHCEAWRLDACGEIALEEDSFANVAYDDAVYDDLPTYVWGPSFSDKDFADAIDFANGELWTRTKIAICRRLSFPIVLSGFPDYATRRVRRQIHGPDLASVMAKQITIPLIVPHDLEEYILHTLPSRYPSLPEHFTSHPCLIPLHDPNNTQYIGPIPSLADTGTEDGNLRFWVIDNNSMWASQHRVMDEIYELLWSLFYWLTQQSENSRGNFPVRTSSFECLAHMARSLRRRIVLPEVSDNVELGPGFPGKREACLFRTWALDCPKEVDDTFLEARGRHPLFQGNYVRYPFEDRLFWKGDKEELKE